MTIREQTEEIEKKTLHPKACLSSQSKGRTKPEKEGVIRTCFQRDRDRIIHSSLRVIDFLEQNRKGLNLTHEVRNGIVKHLKGKGFIIPEKKAERADTLEGQVVRVSDIIAYVNHDLDDARMGG